MAGSISSTEKRAGRGRPRTDPVAQHFTMPQDLSKGIDAFIAAQPDPKPSRPEAIRLALRDWLSGQGYLPGENTETTGDAPQGVLAVDRYGDADPEEGVMVTGVGPMTLRRAVRKLKDWREHHGLGLITVYRGADKKPVAFDEADLRRLADIERFC